MKYISYDLTDKHTQFKNRLINKGYSNLMTSVVSGRFIELPNTLLVTDKELSWEEYFYELYEVAQELEVEVSKVFLIDSTQAWGTFRGQ